MTSELAWIAVGSFAAGAVEGVLRAVWRARRKRHQMDLVRQELRRMGERQPTTPNPAEPE